MISDGFGAAALRRRCLTAAFCWIALVALPAGAADTKAWVQDSDVRVEHNGDRFTVDVVFLAPVPPAVAWAVLTDFSRMTAFVPNLHSSEVLERHGNRLKVQQKGAARYAILSAAFESVREIQLLGQHEIRSHNVAGTVRQMDSVMKLQADGASSTRMHYHAEVVPGVWIPPLIGVSLVRHETAEQFSAMVREMVRELARRQ